MQLLALELTWNRPLVKVPVLSIETILVLPSASKYCPPCKITHVIAKMKNPFVLKIKRQQQVLCRHLKDGDAAKEVDAEDQYTILNAKFISNQSCLEADVWPPLPFWQGLHQSVTMTCMKWQ